MKLKIAFLLLATFLFSNAFAFDKWDNTAANLKGMRILLYTKNGKGYVHKNIPSSIVAIQKLSKEQGFKLDTSTNAGVFTDENLKKYNAVIFSNTNNNVFDTEAQKVAFMRYTQAGGGFVGIHSACGTERQWTWFKQMMGGTFQIHAEFGEFNVMPADERHPSVAGMPKVWTVKDECYFLKEMNPTIRVLMVHNSENLRKTTKLKLPDTFMPLAPAVWCNEFDGGRQWYTTLGHSNESYADATYLKHLLGGIRWAAAKKVDYSKAKATKSEV